MAANSPHATHAIISVNQIVKVPENIDVENACFHIIAAGVINSVRLARVSLSDAVAVVRLIILGQLAIIFSRMAGAYPVVAVNLLRRGLATRRNLEQRMSHAPMTGITLGKPLER